MIRMEKCNTNKNVDIEYQTISSGTCRMSY